MTDETPEAPPVLTTEYATPDDLREMADDLDVDVADDYAVMARLLNRARDDLDTYLAWPAPTGDTLDRIDVETLTPYQRDRLRRAACAQALYRIAIEEDGLLLGRSVVGMTVGDVTLPAIPPEEICQQAKTWLTGSGLVRSAPCDVTVDPQP
jgi:hypothetical protein